MPIHYPIQDCFIVPGEGCLNIKISSYQYRDSHYKDKTFSWPSYLYNGNLHIWKKHLYIETGPSKIPKNIILIKIQKFLLKNMHFKYIFQLVALLFGSQWVKVATNPVDTRFPPHTWHAGTAQDKPDKQGVRLRRTLWKNKYSTNMSGSSEMIPFALKMHLTLEALGIGISEKYYNYDRKCSGTIWYKSLLCDVSRNIICFLVSSTFSWQ